MAQKQIYYSDKYFDEQYEYRYEAAGGPAGGIRKGGSCRAFRRGAA